MGFPALAVYLDKRKIMTYTVLAFVLGSLLGGAMWNIGGIYMPDPLTSTTLDSGSLFQFTSYDEMKTFLSTMTDQNSVRVYWDIVAAPTGRGFSGSIDSATSAASAASSVVEELSFEISELADSAFEVDYSGTNVQVEGVDEADLVKTDGEYIYIVRGDTLIIVKAYPPEEAEVVARVRLYQLVRDIFINGDKLVVFLRMSKNVFYDVVGSVPPPGLIGTTTIQVYNVSDRSAPSLEREVTIDGSYFSSRMIGDHIYVIIRRGAVLEDGEVALPTFSSQNRRWEVEPSDVYYVNITDSMYFFTNIVAIDVQDSEAPFTSETFLLGRASDLYVSHGNIYISACNWMDETTVYKISIDGGAIAYVADGKVPGYVLNQFSMDEHDGYFRIATTTGQVSRSGGSSKNHVYVLNESLGIVGELEDLAPGETIYSARFMGDRCYLVTFKKIDPLFAIDLSDPYEPRILGKLKIPGFSDYLHPYDENHLIGLGKETVEAEEGDFAWHQGVKISLFDVTNVSHPTELAKLEIGDRGSWSPALEDHKAFLFSRARNLLVIPILVAEIDESARAGSIHPSEYGEYVFQGAYVFHVSTEGIVVRGRVTHLDDLDDLLKSGYWFESEYEVDRSLYIGDVLYTLSEGMVKMNSLFDLSELGTVDIS